MAKAAKPKTPAKSESAPTRSASPVQSDDPALDALTEGIAALQGGDWAKAVRLFETAVEESDRPEVRDRARQFLTASRQKAQADEKAKPAKDGAESDSFLQAVYEKN